MTTKDFFQNLSYAYFKSYSMQAHADLFQQLPNFLQQKNKELAELPISETMIPIRSKLKRQIQDLINHINGEAISLSYVDVLPETAFLVKTVMRNSQEDAILVSILSTSEIEVWYHRCMPVFRDVIVFYDNEDKAVDILNICFECEEIRSGQQNILETDYRAYRPLYQLLTQMGHTIEH